MRKREIIADLPMTIEELSFECADKEFCGEGKELTVSENEIVVKRNTRAVVVVCGNEGVTNYFIVIGRDKDKTSTTRKNFAN